MWRELDVLGVLMSPLVAYMVVAAVLYVPVRVALVRSGLARFAWHFPLAGAALYVCILGLLVRFL